MSPESFSFYVPFTVTGYAGSESLENFPVLVRLADGQPMGFHYYDCAANGTDLRFADNSGNLIPHEIDTWNASGESLVWVRVPVLSSGATFRMFYGSNDPGATAADDVWSRYAVVIHGGDSLANAVSGGVAVSAGSTAVSATAGSGVVGGGVNKSTANAKGLNVVNPAKADALANNNEFSLSGWFKRTGSGTAILAGSRMAWNSHDGFLWLQEKSDRISVAANNSHQLTSNNKNVLSTDFWTHLAFTVNDTVELKSYFDGALDQSKTSPLTLLNTSNDYWTFGSYSNTASKDSYSGDMDELRIFDGVASGDWIKAEHDTVASASFLTAGQATHTVATPAPQVGVVASDVQYTNATVTVSVLALGSDATSADVGVELAATSDFATPLWSTSFTATEAGSREFAISGLVIGTTYFVRGTATNNRNESVSFGPASFTTRTPGAPMASANVSGRTDSSISTAVTVSAFGEGSDACAVRLEASTNGFATVAAFAESPFATPGSATLTVSGLSTFTVYALRLRVTNPWGLATLVDLGTASTLPPSGISELYVDSLGTGNGLSPESALPTIRQALDIAGPGYTIWVRGGEGRAYGVTNETDTLPIPATLEGLSVRAYEVTPGDAGLALVAISDTYIVDDNRAHIISNRAANVTVSGLDFSFGTTSVGKQNVDSCSILWTAAPFTTLENCLLRMPQPTVYAGSGASSPLVICTSKDATNIVVRGCEFRNTRCWSATHGYAPIKVKSNALIACNVFSNVNATVTGQQADLVYGRDTSCYDLTFVSNVVYGANDGGNLSAAFLFGLFPGPKSAEIAFNRFVADPGARAQNGGAIAHRVNVTFGAQFAEAFSGKEATLVHHNTIIGGQSAFLFNDTDKAKRKNQFFSNLILLSPGGTNLVDSSSVTAFSEGRTTSFVAPSCLRNNAYTGVLTGGNATELADYDLSSGLEIADNIALVASPDFVCTDDIYHEDFYRYKSVHGDGDLGRLGWTGENNEYPAYIGALPPLYPSETLILFH